MDASRAVDGKSPRDCVMLRTSSTVGSLDITWTVIDLSVVESKAMHVDT